MNEAFVEIWSNVSKSMHTKMNVLVYNDKVSNCTQFTNASNTTSKTSAFEFALCSLS